MRKLQLTKETSPEIIKAKMKASLTFQIIKDRKLFIKFAFFVTQSKYKNTIVIQGSSLH